MPGDAKYRDINNDDVINSDDLTVIGNGQPDFIWGFNNTLSYKNLELNFFIQGVHGNEVFNFLKGYMLGGNGDARDATTVDILNRWTPQNENTDVPGYSSTNKNVIQSSRNVEDGSYVKLKSITFGYNLPRTLLKKVKIADARIFVSGQNLLTISNYSGFDPEVSSSGSNDVDLGIDWGAYPNPKTITVGLNVKF